MIAMLIGALLASAPPETALHVRWRACTDQRSNNYDFDQCGGVYVKAADAQLNSAWGKLMAAVASEPQTQAALRTEQRSWLAYRDNACAFYGVQADWGREGEVLSRPECVAGVLERRTAELRGYLASTRPR